jgi:tRNA (guanosine-2'-O-)-methyltransferase
LLEDIYQSQNASAVLRTCDCTGIQDVHIIEEYNQYEVNPDVSLGASKWLSMYYFRSGFADDPSQYNRKPGVEGGEQIRDAVRALKANGYRIVATSPHESGSSPEHFDLEKGKAALMFGTEKDGLTRRALDLADEFIRIPMQGFSESYNISVSVAVILYSLRKRMEQTDLDWRLTEEERKILLLDWLRESIKLSDRIEQKFRQEHGSDF